MSDNANPETPDTTKMLADMQHWTWVMGRAQQMVMEHTTRQVMAGKAPMGANGADWPKMLDQMMQAFIGEKAAANDPSALAQQSMAMWSKGLDLWNAMARSGIAGLDAAAKGEIPTAAAAKDRRFAHEAWDQHPIFQTIKQSYALAAEHMLGLADKVDGLDGAEKERLRFQLKGMVDAVSPSNFVLTNPQVLQKALDTRGESLLAGLEKLLKDMERGQLTHTDESAFELGINIANTPGKVVHRTPLYELIHYAPTTETVGAVPLLIFPPWINRFYILDLGEQKSFVKWAVDQGLSVFLVSWKSADATMADTIWDDYIAAQIDAIDTVRGLLGVDSVHTIGYCVAGTTLAATLAYLAATGGADKVASATFFTAQVDFSEAGELRCFLSDEHMAMIETLSGPGYLDGRYMAATFNALRGNDLIWSYVVNNYLMGEPYRPFDLLYWNGDTTNVPAKWHKDYLERLYRRNELVQAGAISVMGVPLDLTRIATPAYVQAGKEDHIAPVGSVWKIMKFLQGPKTFLLAGSGHIAGVVNPPAANKYQHWVGDSSAATLDEFIASTTEHPGSWWPHWREWLRALDGAEVPAKKARVPGKGKSKGKAKGLPDAPGDYVRMR